MVSTDRELKKLILKNTAAGYALTFTSFVTAIFITRILYTELGNVAYGFWALLWSVFSYSILLDFGFGISVQKYTSEVTVTDNFEQYNRLLNTVLGSYALMSLIIVGVTVIVQFFLGSIFRFPEGTDIAYYRKVFILFGLGTALVFPTGAFAEVLRGLKKIYLFNFISIANRLAQFAGIYLIFKLDKGLMTLAVFTLGLNLATNAVMGITILHLLPQVKIGRRWFELSRLKEVCSFSLFAYLIICSNIVIYQTAHIVVGFMLGMYAVAIYHVGTRISGIMVQLATRFQDNLLPIAASLYKANEHQRLQQILIRSNRLIAFIAFILFITLTALAEPILYVWLKVVDRDAVLIAYIMNTALFLDILFKSGSAKVLLMAGNHKFLTVVSLSESVANLVCSIIFIRLCGVIGVALGALLPGIVVTLFVILPVASKFSRIKISTYLRKIYFPLAMISLPSIAILCFSVYRIPVKSWNVVLLFAVSFAAGCAYLVTSYLFFLQREERQKLRNFIRRRTDLKVG